MHGVIMEKSIAVKPAHVPEGAWEFFCEIDPNHASIKGKPFKLWPEAKQRYLERYINIFGERMCLGTSSLDLWDFWIENYAPDGEISGTKSKNFAEALFYSHGSLKEFRDKCAAEKKSKTKESIQGHIRKLVKLVENTECIVGLQAYCKEKNVLSILQDFEKFMENAHYGFNISLSSGAIGQAQLAALKYRKSVSHIDFQRVFGKVLVTNLNYAQDAKLIELIARAQICMFPDAEIASDAGIRLNLKPQKKKRS